MVIFDWDGTLCDSLDQIVAAMQAAASEQGVTVPTPDAVRDIVGLGLPQAVATVFPGLAPAQREAMARAYSEQYVARDSGPATLYEGALETLHALRDRGLQLAVATGKSRRGLNRVLAGLGMEDFFDATRCADETRSKPHPLMLQELMEERQVAARHVVMVGDTEYDLEMASNAGVASVGVSFGVHEPERLQKHGPVAVVDSLVELLQLPQLGAS